MVKPASLVRMSKTQQRRGLQPDPAAHGVSPGVSAEHPPSPSPLVELPDSVSAGASLARAGVARAKGLAAEALSRGVVADAPVVFGPGGRVKTQAGVARDSDPLLTLKTPAIALTNSVSHVTIPLRTQRGENNREHPMARHRRVRKEHIAVGWALVHAFGRQSPFTPPLLVTLTRHAPSDGLDDDNLAGALKAVRDEVADYLGVNDKHSDRVRYAYAQKRSSRNWAVRIDIAPMPPTKEPG